MKARALVQTLLMGFAGIAMDALGYATAARVIWGLAGFFLLLAALAPSVYDTSQELVTWLASRLTTGIGLVVLVAVYYLIFVPGALLMRTRRRDPLRLEFPPPDETNWTTRVGFGADPALYTKQYTRPHGAEDAGA